MGVSFDSANENWFYQSSTDTLDLVNGAAWSSPFSVGSPSGGKLNVKVSTVSKTCNSGSSPETITGIIPANAIVLGVSARVTTAISGASLTTWDLGDSGDDNRYANAKGLTVGTTVTSADYTARPDTEALFSTSARDILITANAGQFDAGVLKVSVFYLDTTAPSS